MEPTPVNLPDSLRDADRPSAEIIPFPRTPAPVPQDRLAAALATLDRAIEEQRAAIGGGRAAMADLDQAMGSLAGSVGTYQAQLGVVAGSVDALEQQAAKVARI